MAVQHHIYLLAFIAAHSRTPFSDPHAPVASLWTSWGIRLIETAPKPFVASFSCGQLGGHLAASAVPLFPAL